MLVTANWVGVGACVYPAQPQSVLPAVIPMLDYKVCAECPDARCCNGVCLPNMCVLIACDCDDACFWCR